MVYTTPDRAGFQKDCPPEGELKVQNPKTQSSRKFQNPKSKPDPCRPGRVGSRASVHAPALGGGDGAVRLADHAGSPIASWRAVGPPGGTPGSPAGETPAATKQWPSPPRSFDAGKIFETNARVAESEGWSEADWENPTVAPKTTMQSNT
jgi:hypothetical protein